MGMKLIFVAALSATCAVFLAHSAPTSLASGNNANTEVAAPAVAAEIPLVRTKRAEEILYGNHQNAPRVKKSDPAVSASEDDISTKNDDVIKDDAKTSSTVLDEKEKTVDSEAQSAPTGEQDEIPSKNEPLHNVEDIPAELNDADYQRYEDQEEGSEDAEALRKKRSIKTVMMTAENMAGSSSRSSLVSRPVRAKRDLDYEDLRQLFADSREAPYEQEELEESEGPGDRIYVMSPEQGAEEEEDVDVDGEDEEESAPGVGPNVPLSVALRPYQYQPSYDPPSEKEELLRELVERKVEEDAREKLLDYLLAAAIASEAESTDEAETDANGDDDEGFSEDGPGRQDYEDESARDVIGSRPPVALKRNDFYPYSYEPYGGRWGAMVPGTKRSANEYERLYRLAEALNADDDYEEQ